MCSSASKYKKLEKAIKGSWASVIPPEIKIIFYVDNQRTLFKKKVPELKGNDLILPCKDGYLNCAEKTLWAFEYVLANFHFEYIFRTNLGSYVNFEKAIDFLKDKPKKEFYSGIIGFEAAHNINFASGSGFFLSKDLVELLVSNSNLLNRQLIDDVAFGLFMSQNNIVINRQARRLSYTDDIVEYQIGAETVPVIDNQLIYHVRLRSSDRNIDIKRMYSLFDSKF